MGKSLTARVVERARSRGVDVLDRSQWGTEHEAVYQARRQRPTRQPAGTVWQHITVTLDHGPLTGDFKTDVRTVERIGMERFGSGVSYNFLVDMRTGMVAVGQPLDAPGTHTIIYREDLLDSGEWSKDQNWAGRAIAVLGMPGDTLSAKAETAIAELMAAMVLERAVYRGFDYKPHSFAVAGTPYAKDCPCDATRDKMLRIRRRVSDLVSETGGATEPLTLATWNAWVGQDPRELVRNLGALVEDVAELTGREPHAIALQEVKRFGGTVRGYERVAVEPLPHRPEAASNVLLVRQRGVEVVRDRRVVVDGPDWKGPHGVVHRPRVFPGATIRVDAGKCDLLDVHRVPGGPWGRNRGAWRAEDAALADWLASRPAERPVVPLGDWNGRAADPRRYGLPDLAERTDTSVHVVGIDGALARGVRLRARKLPELYGSDAHRPVILEEQQ